jgi:hypothetical protein
MIKKLYISLLLSLKIAGSDTDPSDCLTCYASSCLFGCSAITAASIGTDLCIKGSSLGCSAATCKAGEYCHRQCVYNFDPNNPVDTTCAKISGLLAAKYCIDCAIYTECPYCLPIFGLVVLHNGLKIAEESMTDSFSAPYNQQTPKVKSMKNN